MIPVLDTEERRGELIRPERFFPVVDWPHAHKSYAYGPYNIVSGLSQADMSRGNYQFPWVAYVEGDGSTYMQKKLHNGLWDGAPRHLLDLTNGVQKISLEFSPDGTVILGYLKPDGTLGVWWRNPDTTLPQLLDLESGVQEMLLGVENKDTPDTTDIFLWYFLGGELFLRTYSERFAIVHGPFVSGISEPVILQAGINHRYGYQVDYRDMAE